MAQIRMSMAKRVALVLAVGLLPTSLLAKDASVHADTPATETGCAQFGPGFHKLGGRETCMKIDGRLRVESTYLSGGEVAFSPASSNNWLH